jgi:hypothetical protein
VADLRTILAPPYATRAREIATRMTKSAESVAAAADLMENFARDGSWSAGIPHVRGPLRDEDRRVDRIRPCSGRSTGG